MWPTEEDLKKMDPEKIPTLKLSKIKWYRGGSILSIQCITNDGQESPVGGGNYSTDATFEIPDDKTVRKVKILASENWVNKMQFFDDTDNQIGNTMSTADRGDWTTFELEEGERLVGMQAHSDGDNHMRRFGLVTLKQP